MKNNQQNQGNQQQKTILWLNFWQLHMVLAVTLTVPNVRKSYIFGGRVKQKKTAVLL